MGFTGFKCIFKQPPYLPINQNSFMQPIKSPFFNATQKFRQKTCWTNKYFPYLLDK